MKKITALLTILLVCLFVMACGTSEGGEIADEVSMAWDYAPAIMTDGVVYISTGTVLAVEPVEEDLRTVSAYTDTWPTQDGETNFDNSLQTRYGWIAEGLIVSVNGEWTLFEPYTGQTPE